jgi:hypothetical protein
MVGALRRPRKFSGQRGVPVTIKQKGKGQAGTRPGLLDEAAHNKQRAPDLFLGCRRWGRRFPCLRTSPESQSTGQYGRDHDHF